MIVSRIEMIIGWMTRKERVLGAIGHRDTGGVPWNIELTGSEAKRVCEYAGIGQDEFFEWAGNHIEKISYNIGGKEVSAEVWEDEFGVKWDRSGLDKDIGVIRDVTLREARLDEYELPSVPLEQVKKATEKALNNGKDTFKFGKIGTTLFERAWSLRGMENLLMDFLAEPAFAEKLLGRIADYNLAIIEAATGFDIDGFYFGDDYGSQQGLLMSPDTWRRFVRPGLVRMFERVKRAGKTVALHSCGNIREILGDLIDIGLDVYQTVQPEVYDLGKLKKEYGRHLTFWGAISTQQALPFAKPEEVKRLVRETIATMGESGGYIAGPTHRVPQDVPPENVVAMVEALRGEQRN